MVVDVVEAMSIAVKARNDMYHVRQLQRRLYHKAKQARACPGTCPQGRGGLYQVLDKPLCMLCEEDCRTAVLGKTERTVGWEGNGEPAMTKLVRHCHEETRSN
jgi:hypothetical protein